MTPSRAEARRSRLPVASLVLALLVAIVTLLVLAGPLGGGPAPPDHRGISPPPRLAEPPGFMAGVVEGFYGPTWSPAGTLAVMAALHQDGLNTFVYAPKDDPYARARWAVPYPPAALARLGRLVTAAHKDGLRFVYALSPGLSIEYGSPADRARLLAKIRQVEGLGVQTFMLSFDDIPPHLTHPADIARYPAGLGQAESRLADWVLATVRRSNPAFRLLFTPTDYYGLQDGPYWNALRTYLAAGVAVLWTGPQVLSPAITSSQALIFAHDVGHPVILWDNYPVNDYTYVVQHAPRLFLGPFRNRSPRLPDVLAGYLANPMLQARASLVALDTLALYLQNPARYQPTTAFDIATRQVAGPATAAFRLLAEDCSASFLTQGGTLSPWPGEIRAFVAHPSPGAAARLKQTFETMAGLNAVLARKLPNHALFREIEPWTRELAAQGQDGLAGLVLFNHPPEGAARTQALGTVRAGLQALAHAPVMLDTSRSMAAFLARAETMAGADVPGS